MAKCVIRGTKKVMPHDELMKRLRKTLYYGDPSYQEVSVSRPLAEYASELFSEPQKGHSLHRLNKVTAGSIQASPCSLIMALIYLDRLQATDPNYVRRITPSELFIVSMMVSTKFYCGHDEEVYLSDWAKEGKMSDERMKELELEFLCAIDWNIYISNDQFFEKLQSIEKILARREGLRRGWLTYTELLNLLPSFTIAKFLLNNIAVMAVSYAASVMTIAGAFFLVSHIPGNALRKTTDIQFGNNPHQSSSPADIIHTNGDKGVNDRLRSDGTTDDNGLCPFMDIEEELRKLENQYNESTPQISQNNENSGPLINLNGNYPVMSTKIGIESGVNWQSFMDDENDNSNTNCLVNRNCSRSILWDIFIDGEKRFLQLPFLWFKFI